jgi:hypothetical protein
MILSPIVFEHHVDVWSIEVVRHVLEGIIDNPPKLETVPTTQKAMLFLATLIINTSTISLKTAVIPVEWIVNYRIAGIIGGGLVRRSPLTC